MARRFRRFGRRVKSFGKKAYRRASSGRISPVKMLLPAFLYGGVRAKVSELAAPLTSKIPLGNFADEAAFGLVGYLAATKGRGMIKDAGMAILTVEAASVGNQVMGGMVSGSGNSSGGVQFYG